MIQEAGDTVIYNLPKRDTQRDKLTFAYFLFVLNLSERVTEREKSSLC